MKKTLLTAILLFTLSVSFPQIDRGLYIHSFNVTATDPDTLDEGYWTISAGNIITPNSIPSRKLFAIKPRSGEVVVDTTVYKSFVTQKTITITLRYTDMFGYYDYGKRKITLRKDSSGRRLPSIVVTTY